MPKPHPRQADFLNLDCREALYGGAAGAGKSHALLTWLAQGIHLPKYSGILFRRTLQDLKKSNDSIIAKTHELFVPVGGTFNASENFWTFPSGARIELGGLEHGNSVYKYLGSAYHRIAFDELTTFTEEQYLYLFTRLRSTVGFPLSLGIRATTNPGGEGHLWVLNRFVTREAIETMRGWHYREQTPQGLVFWNEKRAFVPARLADNPTLDFDSYVQSLQETNPVLRERMLNGDWEISPEGQIKPDWLRYYTMRGSIIALPDCDLACDDRQCNRFATIDPAGTSEDKSKEARGKSHSYSVIQVWDQFPQRYGTIIALRYCLRKRLDFTQLIAAIRDIHKEFQPRALHIENEKLGVAIVNMLQRELPIHTIATGGKDKLTRAGKLLNMLEKGQVFLPKSADKWLQELQSEWLSWRGTDGETSDQVDAAAYAAILAHGTGPRPAVGWDITRGTEGL